MHAALATLIDRLDDPAIAEAGVIRWGCPVPSFGDLSHSRVATLGLNPSNREFVDERGRELEGPCRRFHTLSSLGIPSWSDADARHLRLILRSCQVYFHGNPYNTWFRKLDYVISGAKASFYEEAHVACHLDLIPYATEQKWTELSSRQRMTLLTVASDTLGLLVRDSPVRILILNGRSVVDQFEAIAGTRLNRRTMASWSLPRRSRADVTGVAYRGIVETLAGIRLERELLVLGFNHNLQSSFGVTTGVMGAIRRWITRAASQVAQ